VLKVIQVLYAQKYAVAILPRVMEGAKVSAGETIALKEPLAFSTHIQTLANNGRT
jgi:hypothetical protein